MEALRRILVGLGVGSFVSLLFVFVSGGAYISRIDIICCFAISAFAGVATLLFSLTRLSYLTCLALHYVLTLGFVMIIYSVVDPTSTKEALIVSGSIVYVISYGVVLIRQVLTVHRLSALVAHRSSDAATSAKQSCK